MGQLEGRVVIVTGSTQGLGEAIALHAADSGADGVVICGRSEDRGRAVVGAIEDRKCAAEFVTADLSQAEDCRNVVRQCDKRFGRVDGLVNAAADTHRGTLEDTSVDFWDYQFAVNVRAPFLLTQEAARVMKARGDCRIDRQYPVRGSLLRDGQSGVLQYNQGSAADLHQEHGRRSSKSSYPSERHQPGLDRHSQRARRAGQAGKSGQLARTGRAAITLWPPDQTDRRRPAVYVSAE